MAFFKALDRIRGSRLDKDARQQRRQQQQTQQQMLDRQKSDESLVPQPN